MVHLLLAAEAIEGVNQIVTGSLTSLSEQELVDCDTPYNLRCNGSLMDYAFQFITSNGGLDSEDDYPYKANDGSCDAYRKNAHVVTIYDYEDVPEKDEKALKKVAAINRLGKSKPAEGRSSFMNIVKDPSGGNMLKHSLAKPYWALSG